MDELEAAPAIVETYVRRVDALMAQVRLEDHEIPASVADDWAQGYNIAAFHLYVHPDQLVEAGEILQAARSPDEPIEYGDGSQTRIARRVLRAVILTIIFVTLAFSIWAFFAEA